jgi:hypothetical protein
VRRMGALAAAGSSQPDLSCKPRVMRREAALLALVVALQLVLPSIHALAQRDASSSVDAALRDTRGRTALFVEAAASLRADGALAHHAESCPQCQAFAQARSQTVPTHGAVPAPAFSEHASLLASPEQLLPAAPTPGSGSPRSPPASRVLS